VTDVANATVLAAVISGNVAVAVTFLSDIRTRRREIAVRLGERNHDTMVEMLDALGAGTKAVKQQRKPTQDELDRLGNLAQQAWLIAPDRVIKEWQKLQALTTQAPSDAQLFRQYGRFLTAMRQDMGHTRFFGRVGVREALRTLIVPQEWANLDKTLKGKSS
jgi:hypothetical protein